MKSETIDFPYSDHKLIACQCDFESVKARNTNQFKLLRKLDEKNLEALSKRFLAIDHTNLNSIINPEKRVFSFKNYIINFR